MSKPKITVYIGMIGAGKGYQSQKLVDKGAVKVSFADTLRNLAYNSLGIAKPTDYDEWKKNTAYITSVYGNGKFETAKAVTGREYLQKLGVSIRQYDPEFFINLAIQNINKALSEGKDVVIDDCRYENELDRLHFLSHTNKIDMDIIFCDYKSDRYDDSAKHESEALALWYKNLGFKDLDLIGGFSYV